MYIGLRVVLVLLFAMIISFLVGAIYGMHFMEEEYEEGRV